MGPASIEFPSIIWDDSPGGNVEHIAEHGLTPEDVDYVLHNPIERTISRSSGQPLYMGRLSDERLVYVVFERIDDATAVPVTAYMIEEDSR